MRHIHIEITQETEVSVQETEVSKEIAEKRVASGEWIACNFIHHDASGIEINPEENQVYHSITSFKRQ